MARSIRQIKYGEVLPSKILFGDGTECKRVYAGDTMVWNKDDYAFSINPTQLNAEPTAKSYNISVVSTNDGGDVLVPYTATSTVDWITPRNNGDEITVAADDEPREDATESLRIYGDAYVSNAGGVVNLPEIECVWKNTVNRIGEVNYRQGEDSELEATLKVTQKLGSGLGTYHIESKSDWLHVGADGLTVTADQYFSPTLSRNGSLVVISDLTGEVETLTVTQANILAQKKEYGIFSTLNENYLPLSCTQTTGDAKIIIRYRYYQVNAETDERIPASETAWIDSDFKSWTVSINAYFTGTNNSSTVTCTSNAHKLDSKRGSLTYTLQPSGVDIPNDEISSVNTVEISILQDADFFINNGEIFSEYRINGGSIPEINAAGDAVQASINSEYRRYKIWNSDKAIEYFEGTSWKGDIGATFVSQSVSGYAFYYNGINVSSVPNTDPSLYNEGVGRFISNRVMNGQPLYIDLTIRQKYREKTTEYRFINAEMTVNGKASETWSPNAADQSKTFNIVSKVLRQYKWTDRNWYDNVPNTKENWDYASNSITWCGSSDNLSARTTTLHALANNDLSARDFTIVIRQKEDSHLNTPLSVTISVSQAGRVPVTPVVSPGTDPFVPDGTKTRLKDCRISVNPTTYSINAGAQSKNNFAVDSTAIVEYLYTDGEWYAEPNRYKIGYTATNDQTSWCTSTPQETTAKATVSVLANSATEQRTATVTLEQKYSNYDSSVKKTATISVTQAGRVMVEPEQIQWKNCKISATLPSYEFEYPATTATFTVVSTADRWSLYTDGIYYQTSNDETLPYSSAPTSGGISTNGLNVLNITEYMSTTPRTQDITFTQKAHNGVATGATDTKTIKQKGDAPVQPEQWESRNYVLTVSPTTWNIDAAAHTSSDFTYVSTKDRYQLWLSGWKKIDTVGVGVDIESASSTGRIKITSAASGKISVSAEAWDNVSTNDTKTLKIIQRESSKEGAIAVTQSKAVLVSPEQSKLRSDGYSISVNPTSLTWLQTESSAKSVTVTSYGYRVYLYTDGQWRGKTNQTTTGDKENVGYSASATSHWTTTNKTSFTPNKNADKDYNETVTYTQTGSSKTASVSLTHKYAQPLVPEVPDRRNYRISITAPSKPLSITQTTAKTTSMSVESKCDVWIKYDDGNFYYNRTEDVDYTVSPSSKQGTNNYCYGDLTYIYTRNQYSTSQLSQTITVTQATSSKTDTIAVTVSADSKSAENTRYRINSVTIPTISYTGAAVTATVENQKQTYKNWASDDTEVDTSSWVADSGATVTSVFASGDSNIRTDGGVSISATNNSGSTQRTATFNFSNNRGAIKNGIVATQGTANSTEYELIVTPATHTFTTPANGNVKLTVTCRYRTKIGTSAGEWQTCDYTTSTTGSASYTKSTTTATLPTNSKNTTALTGTIVFTANNMSTSTYPGTPATATVTLTGCADKQLSGSEYKIASATIPTISVVGTAVTASITCQRQDYTYWQSIGTGTKTITKSWYNITTPSGVTSTRKSGDSNISTSGTSVSANSNSGSTTYNTLYQVSMNGGKTDIAYYSASSSTFTVTQEYKAGTGRNSTSARSAVITFTVPFPTGSQTADATASQSADGGASITYPTSWSRDTTKNHTITSSGSSFLDYSTVTGSNGVWTYTAQWGSNEGTSFTGTEYRFTVSPTSLSFAASDTSKTITVTHQKRDVTGGRTSTNQRSQSLSVSYYGESAGPITYTQAGDPGSSGSGSGSWSTDTGGSISSATSSNNNFSTSVSGNTITVSTSANTATANEETRTSHVETTPNYSNYSLTIDNHSDTIPYAGGTTSHTVTATRTVTPVYDDVWTTTYNSTSQKTTTISIQTNRISTTTDVSTTQSGDSKASTTRTAQSTGTPETKSYTPNLTFVSDYPKNATAGTAPSMSVGTGNGRTEISDGTDYYVNVGAVSAFDYTGGTKSPSLTFTKADRYYYGAGDSRTITGKCHDSVGNVNSNEFTATQAGQSGDSTIKHKTAVSDTSSYVTFSITSGSSYFSANRTNITAISNSGQSTSTVYSLTVSPTSGSINVNETATPTVTVQEATKTTNSTTSAKSGQFSATHSRGGTVTYTDRSLTLNGDTRSGSSEGSYASSSVGYTSSSDNTSVATVSGNTITGKSAGNATITFKSKGTPAGSGKSLTGTYTVTVTKAGKTITFESGGSKITSSRSIYFEVLAQIAGSWVSLDTAQWTSSGQSITVSVPDDATQIRPTRYLTAGDTSTYTEVTHTEDASYSSELPYTINSSCRPFEPVDGMVVTLTNKTRCPVTSFEVSQRQWNSSTKRVDSKIRAIAGNALTLGSAIVDIDRMKWTDSSSSPYQTSGYTGFEGSPDIPKGSTTSDYATCHAPFDKQPTKLTQVKITEITYIVTYDDDSFIFNSVPTISYI